MHARTYTHITYLAQQSLQVYCCLGALAITDSLHLIDADNLGWWLCERQLPSGGLNGMRAVVKLRLYVDVVGLKY